MNLNAQQQARRSALTLLTFAVACTAVLAGTYAASRDTVLANEAAARAGLLAQTLPGVNYDNRLESDSIALSAEDGIALGNDGPSSIYLARQGGQPSAFVLETTAPNGYAGKIKLLVGINAAGNITGVRVVGHKETPGLGDYIDAAKSSWSQQFNGQSAELPGWKVKKDGGQFDYMSGATISARAVTGAVGRAAEYFRTHRQQLLAGKAKE